MRPKEIDELVKRRLQEGARFVDIRKEVASKFGYKTSSAGYIVWRIKRELQQRPVRQTQAKGKPVSEGRITGESEHQRLVGILYMLGEVFGFESTKSVKLSQFCRGVPASMTDRTVDVLWSVQGHNHPIEVQVHGNIDSLVRRLETAEPDSKGMIVVGSREDLDAVKQEIEQQKPKGFTQKMIYIDSRDLRLMAGNVESLYTYRKELGI